MYNISDKPTDIRPGIRYANSILDSLKYLISSKAFVEVTIASVMLTTVYPGSIVFAIPFFMFRSGNRKEWIGNQRYNERSGSVSAV